MLLTLRIQLADVKKPPVWRKLTVPGQFTFHRLHLLIQAAFGWENYHLYMFCEQGHQLQVVITEPSGQDWREERDSHRIKISSVLTAVKQHYQYIYDFGDDWLHKITVEKIEDVMAARAYCIGGKGACPPEDCGGPWGYEALKEQLADPKDPEHEAMKEWLGLEENESWDPDYFDLKATNDIVAML